MISAMKTIIWGSLLIMLVLLLWSIVAVELLKPLNEELAQEGHFVNCERCERAFSDIPNSALTFFQSIVAGDSWGLVSIPIIERRPWTAFIFFGVLASVQLGVMNLILTVIVDRANDARKEDLHFQHLSKERAYEQWKVATNELCQHLDEDNNGELSRDEILNGACVSTEFASLLSLMDISLDDLGTVFDILDRDRSGTISFKEFCDELDKLKSGDSHTLLVLLKHDVNKQYERLTKDMEALRHDFGLSSRLDLHSGSQLPVALSRVVSTSNACSIATTAVGQTGAASKSTAYNSSVSLETDLESLVIRMQGELHGLQAQLASEYTAAVARATMGDTYQLPKPDVAIRSLGGSTGPSEKLLRLASVPPDGRKKENFGHERSSTESGAWLNCCERRPPELIQKN